MGNSQRRTWRKQIRAAKRELKALGINYIGTFKGTARALKDAGIVPKTISDEQALTNVFLRNQKLTKGGLLPAGSVSDFYQSREWSRLAYQCKLRDGRRCMCCGAKPSDGARIVSDHVIPIRLRWDLRLDPSNIQTLCNDCNLGKGSVDQTDFRHD